MDPIKMIFDRESTWESLGEILPAAPVVTVTPDDFWIRYRQWVASRYTSDLDLRCELCALEENDD